MLDNFVEEEILNFDHDEVIDKICDGLRQSVRKLKRRGVVVAISGGIDSSVTSALCTKAFGPNKVFGLLLPEYDSSKRSQSLGETQAKHLGIEYLTEEIGPTLQAIGCYRWRDEAMQRVFPNYNENWKSKITITGGLSGVSNHFNLVVQDENGDMHTERMGLKEYLQVVAATNYKQRIRKTVEYFHADRLNYAVTGTPNRMEYDQGFFVKNGDGSADVKPIAHLYKLQVYSLARHLGLPDEICSVIPTTDTYSLDQGQDEFYYALPYKEMDVALWCYNKKEPAAKLAEILGVDTERAENVYKDIENKRNATSVLHWRPLTLEKVEGPITEPK